VGKASRIQTSVDRLRKQQSQIRNLQATNRNRNTPRPVAATATSGVSAAGDTGGGTGNFIATQGDTMIGPIAVYPNQIPITIDADGIADISKSTELAYTSYVRIDASGPSSVLDTLAGAAFDGQLVWVENVDAIMTIAHSTVGNGGNIVTADGNDIVFTTRQVTPMIFEAALSPPSGVTGGWRVIAGGSTGGGGGISFPIDFPITFLGTIGSLTQNIDFSLSTRHGWKAEFDGDIGLAFNNAPTAEVAYAVFKFKQDGTGGHTLTLPAGTINKDTVEAGFLLGPNEETGIVIEFFNDTFYAFLETGNVVTGGSAGNLSDLVIDVNKDWLAQGVSNFGNLTGVTGIDMDGATATIEGVQLINLFQADQQIDSTSSGIMYQVGDLQSHLFKSQFNNIASFEESASNVFRLNMLDHSIRDSRDITFSDASGLVVFPGSAPAIGFDSVASRFIINYPTGASVFVTENNTIGTTVIKTDSLEANIVTANDLLQIGVDPTVPTVPGEFRNDGTDTTTFSGGAVRNFSNIGTIAGADVFLSNLSSPTSINQDLLPQAGKTLGNSGNIWSSATVNKYVVETAGTILGTENSITADAGAGMRLNTPSGDIFDFRFNNLSRITLANTQLNLTGNAQISNTTGLTFSNVGFSPIADGEFRLNGTNLELQTPEFAVRNTTSVSAELAELSLTKVDASPGSGDNIGALNFKIFDSPTETNYAQIKAGIESTLNSGNLELNVRADGVSNVNAITIEGSTSTSNRTFVSLNSESRIGSDLKFQVPSGSTDLKIFPALNQLGIVVQDNTSFTVGDNGTVAIPTENLPTGGSLTKAVLDTAFGTHKGAIGWDEPSFSDGKLFVRNSDGDWYFFTQDGVITV